MFVPIRQSQYIGVRFSFYRNNQDKKSADQTDRHFSFFSGKELPVLTVYKQDSEPTPRATYRFRPEAKVSRSIWLPSR